MKIIEIIVASNNSNNNNNRLSSLLSSSSHRPHIVIVIIIYCHLFHRCRRWLSSFSLFSLYVTSSSSHRPCLSSCQNQPGMHLVKRLVVVSNIEVVMIVVVIFVVRAELSEVVDSAGHVSPDHQQVQLIVGFNLLRQAHPTCKRHNYSSPDGFRPN